MRQDQPASNDPPLDDEAIVALLLDDVSIAEQAVLAKRTAADAELRERVVALAECLGVRVPDWVTDGRPRSPDAVADVHDAAEPPSDLASRTVDTVLSESTILSPAAAPSRGGGLSLLDAGALAVAAVLVVALVSPALLESRESSRRVACQNQLKELGHALLAYTEKHQGRFPEIGPTDPAGLYTVRLADAGHFTDRQELGRLVVCPASVLAADTSRPLDRARIPMLAELDAAPRVLYERLKHYIGGSFSYALPHVNRGRLMPVTNNGNCRQPILGDSPADHCRTRLVHPGGINVLFDDGGLRFVSSPWRAGTQDNLFRNANREVAAGLTPCDAVLAPSGASPRVPPRIARRTPLTNVPVAPQWVFTVEVRPITLGVAGR
ncbi:MAG: DUF1559 domain-containing protein [Planctomycetota bacterium]